MSDDQIDAINNVRDAIDGLECTSQEVLNGIRRLDDALCGSGGIIPHLSSIIGLLNKTLWLLAAVLVVSMLHLF